MLTKKAKKSIAIIVVIVCALSLYALIKHENSVRTFMSTEDKNYSEFDLTLKEIGVTEVPCYVLISDNQVLVYNYDDINTAKGKLLTEELKEKFFNADIKDAKSLNNIKLKYLQKPIALEIFKATCPDCRSLSKEKIKGVREFFKDYNWHRYYIKSTQQEVLKAEKEKQL